MRGIILEAEVWKSVPGFGGHYEASSWGRVRSLDRVVSGKNGGPMRKCGRILTASIDRAGYRYQCIRFDGQKKGVKTHRMVGLAFGIVKEGMQLNHIDGDKSNNRPSNLEAATSLENNRHARRIGLRERCYGANHYKAKMSESDVKEIISMQAFGFANTWIAEAYGVTSVTVDCIKKGKTWRHLNAYREEVSHGSN